MILAGSFQRAWTGVADSLFQPYLIMAISAVFGVVLGAWYMLWAVERVFFGPSREPPRDRRDHLTSDSTPDVAAQCDIRWHEAAALIPLVVFVVWIGIVPQTFLRPAAPAIEFSTGAARDAFMNQMSTLPEPVTKKTQDTFVHFH